MTTTPPKKGRGLGRGLGAMIPSGPAPEVRVPATSTAVKPPSVPASEESTNIPAQVQGLTFAELPISSITPNPRQPRTVFDDEALAELIFSVREIGLLQPVVVRQKPGDAEAFELIAGERRFRACTAAGFTTIPALIRDTDDEAMLRDALLENLHRADLNALEEAAAYQQMLSDFGCTQEELAARIGRSRAQVSNTMRLMKLPPAVQRRVAAGVLSAGHARALLSLSDSEAMERLAERIVQEGLSVRSVEELIILGEGDGKPRERKQRRSRVRPQDLDDVVRSVSSELADTLDTKIETAGFASTSARGRIIIECADIDDLRRIRDVITNA
jgi:ParB family transcriptional regulator, chromosome partitioning protein